MYTEQTREIAETPLSEREEEFSFEIEELDSQHAMMLLIPLDITPGGSHIVTP